MVGFKVNVPLLRTSASVLAVILVTSGAFAEDEDTAGTEPGDGGIAYENYPPTDLIYVTDPLPPEYPEEDIFDDEPVPVDDTGDDGTGDDGTGDDDTGDDGTGDDGTGGDGTIDIGIIDDGTGGDGADGDGADGGAGDGEVGTVGSDVVMTYDFGPESECGGCEYQNSAGPVLPSAPGGDVVQRSVRRSAASTTAVKDSCVDPERYVAWMCDWQKDLGLIGR